MRVQFTSTVLFVADIARARSLYRDVLQQEIIAERAENVVFSSGLVLRQHAGAYHPPKWAQNRDLSPSRIELYFETDDIDEIADQVGESGLKLLHPLVENPWGQRILRFFDHDVHLIEVGEQVESVVRREAAFGIPAELIAYKTRLPVARILGILADDPFLNEGQQNAHMGPVPITSRMRS